MNAAARKAYERDARLNRWAAWVGMALFALLGLAVMPAILGIAWAAVALLFTL